MKQSLDKFRDRKGFTLLELIAVLIVIGIVAAVVIVRFNDTKDYDLASQLEAVKAHLRLAQFRAMSSSAEYGIKFDSTTTYYFFAGSAPTTPILLPGEKNATVDLSAKESALRITSAPQIVTFSAYGSPGTTNVSVATNAGNITITKNTGYIP